MANQIEHKISYSVGTKLNMGNYESADIHLSETETWEVQDNNEAETLSQERFGVLRERLDSRLVEIANEVRP